MSSSFCCTDENILNESCNTLYQSKLRKLGALKYEYYNTTDINTGLVPSNLLLTEYNSSFSKLNKTPSGTTIQTTYPNANSNFTIVITGFLTIYKSNNFTFQVMNDDDIKFTLTPVNSTIPILNYTSTTSTTYKQTNKVNLIANTYLIKIILIQKSGNVYLNIQYTTDSLYNYFDIPASWISSNYSLNLTNARLAGCGTNPNWMTATHCLNAAKNNIGNTLSDMSNNIINYCKSNSDITNNADTNVCQPLFTNSSFNDNIKKNYCKVNNHFINDNICIDYSLQNRDNDFILLQKDYLSTNINYIDPRDNINKLITNLPISEQKIIYDNYCIVSKDDNKLNSNECTNYISNNINNYNEYIAQYCEKTENNNKNLCNTVFTKNLSDPVIAKSNQYKITQSCLVDNKYITDPTCNEFATNPTNRDIFIQPSVNYCNNLDNSNSTYCNTFYNNAISDLKTGANCPTSTNTTTTTNTFIDNKENFNNNNQSYLSFLSLFIFWILIFFGLVGLGVAFNTLNNDNLFIPLKS